MLSGIIVLGGKWIIYFGRKFLIYVWNFAYDSLKWSSPWSLSHWVPKLYFEVKCNYVGIIDMKPEKHKKRGFCKLVVFGPNAENTKTVTEI